MSSHSDMLANVEELRKLEEKAKELIQERKKLNQEKHDAIRQEVEELLRAKGRWMSITKVDDITFLEFLRQ